MQYNITKAAKSKSKESLAQAMPLQIKLGDQGEARVMSLGNRRSEEMCNWTSESPELTEIGRKEYSIASIERELLRDCQAQADERENGFIAELIRRCPCIKKMKKNPRKSNKILAMLRTLERYNDLMKRLVRSEVDISGKKEADKWSEFLKKNRKLRIEIKCLLTDEEENQKKISELKKSVNAVSYTHLTLPTICSV
eukprot:TRINITY_DN16765_c0_g1_i5.p1 TRINITY_DN16765_c0_g1~~TRINITY_DN16765_c0_g1_i5.p1  ORF type:complete len:197 (+),score=59.21 TRINITY_DN16765_c0_g1_i5:716-1306(+)